MMMTKSVDPANRIRELLAAERGVPDVLANGPRWYPILTNQLALAIGDEHVLYLGAAAGTQTSSSLLRVGLFTATLVVVAEVSDDQPDAPRVTTKVQSRHDLLRFELTGGTEADNESEATWAAGFRIRATYRSGLTVTIPANLIDTDAKKASVHDVLDGLRHDLHAQSHPPS